jgi:septal ring factor EnvC (AmiA/AmiB activator)
MGFWEGIENLFKFFFSLPLVFIIVYVGSIAIGTLLFVMHENLGNGWYSRITALEDDRRKMDDEKERFEDEKDMLKRQRETLKNREKKLNEDNASLSKEKIDFEQAKEALEAEEANFLNVWEAQVFTIDEYVQSVMYPRVLAELKTNSSNAFIKQLKSYRYLLEEDGKKNATTPEVIENVTHLLDDEFSDKEEHDYVMYYFRNKMEKHYNPLLVAWEIYHLYGEKFN